MSAYDNLKLAMIPSGYKDGKLYSVLPENGDADIPFTRGTDATRVNAQGLVESVQIRSGELVQNGDFEQIGDEEITNGDFSNGENGWNTVTGNFDIINGKAVVNHTNDTSVIVQNNVSTVGKIYRVEFTISDYVEGRIRLRYPFINGDLENNPRNGTFVYYGEAIDHRFELQSRITEDASYKVDNISVKEVAQNWSFVGGSYFTGNSARIDNTVTGANAYIIQSNANFTQGKSILFQYDVVQTNGKRCVIEQIGDDIQLDTLTTGTKKQVYFVFDRADTNLLIKRAATGTDVTLDNISVIEVTDDTDIPRLDYTDGSCPALLLEPTRINKLTDSEDFDRGGAFWNTNNDSVSLESGYLAPDGTYGAYKVTQGSNKAAAILWTGSGGILGTDARSIWARTVSGTGQIDLCSHNQNTNNQFTVTEEWQRFEVIGTTSTAGATNFYAVDFRLATTTLTEVIIWGAQSEVGDYVTSYIPTRGTAVTRNRDNPQAANTTVFNDTEGVFYVEVAALSNDGTDRTIAIRNSTDSQEYLNIRIDQTDNKFQMVVRTQGANSTTRGINVNNALEFNKVAIRYKQGESFRIFANGNKQDDTGSAGNPTASGLNQLLIQGSFIGKIKSILYFDSALTDQQCIDLTT